MQPGTIQDLARRCGFALAGVAAALPSDDFPQYSSWVSDGMAGKMGYLTDHRAGLRSDPRSLLSSARSVICVGQLYNRPDALVGGIARYAGGADYHDVMRAGLEKLASALRDVYGDFEYRVCVDTAPLLERSFARLAGLGWIGKNTCLINQDAGSWFFLGELLVSLKLEADLPPSDRCGTCTRCIDACPTDALVPIGERVVLDSRLCISYLTIELKGEVPVDLRGGIGSHLFGCDICQDVCPWNRDASFTEELAYLGGELAPSLEVMALLTEDEFRERFRGTAVWRAKYSGFLRNVAMAMGNSGDARFLPALRRLCGSKDAAVASHAAWGLEPVSQIQLE